MPPKKTAATAPEAKKTGSAIRIIGPAIPLAIALAHGALNPEPAVHPPVSAPTVATSSMSGSSGTKLVADGTVPLPLLAPGHPVDWWFVFKLNASVFPKCGSPAASGGKLNDPGSDTRTCPFGGTAQNYNFGQRYVYASNEQPALTDGGQQCLGTSKDDPVGATFDEVFNGSFHYLIWNDQFHDVGPAVQNCSGGDCGSPWGHSKGMVAWNDAGEGFVMQVSTPSWPGAGNAKFSARKTGNTLGCIAGDDDVEVSQHFFALRLSEPDLMQVLHGLQEASVATDPSDPQIANIGGPKEVTDFFAAATPWQKSKATVLDASMPVTLSSGVKLIAKPSGLNVPPWQMVSSVLGGVSLRAATWWATPPIYSSTVGQVPGCWSGTLPQAPGAVDIALTGTWNGMHFSLKGNAGGNHAKIGVSTSGSAHYAIFGDENQQGTLGPNNCSSSQNGRGGMFFVMDNPTLQANIASLISAGAGDTAPTSAAAK